ncbi:hypothetical protein GNI_013800 [Gregarina niphandrodes]|uniref:Uncharacterized protein n=1 Tax=Gregarina niphandrodes TaxID=110365 RepID=A0A023BCI5_GRENI|nr:hypothetical protein GNI_013800 [Gregarina niphandrodes]EZG83897.1 hypothetical protein GNI_013800 [Gregarina niphandrodes]|eukprot:XP_011128896.1 hypothetical protein GNI_013800 [Gregarina niphandrodes]
MLQPPTTGRTTRRTPATSARLRTQRVPLIRRDIVWKSLQHSEIPFKRWLDRSCPSLANIAFLLRVLGSCIDRADVKDKLEQCIIEHLPQGTYIVSIPQGNSERVHQLNNSAAVIRADPSWGCFGSDLLKEKDSNYDRAILQTVEEVTADSIVCSSAKYRRIHLAKGSFAVTHVEETRPEDEKDYSVTQQSETVGSSRNLRKLHDNIYRYCHERFPSNKTTCDECLQTNEGYWGLVYSSLMTSKMPTYKAHTWSTKIHLHNLLPDTNFDNYLADAACNIKIKSNSPEADFAYAIDVDLNFSTTQIPLSHIVPWVCGLENNIQQDLTEFILAWTFIEHQPYARAVYPNTLPDVVELAAELRASLSANK